MICRVFQKTAGGKKVHISGLARSNSFGNNDLVSSLLPPLMDSSPYNNGNSTKSTPVAAESGHVHCFSNSITAQKSQQEEIFNYFNNNNNNNNPFVVSSTNGGYSSSFTNGGYSSWGGQQLLVPPPSIVQGNYQFSPSFQMQDPSILRSFLENCGQNMMKQGFKIEKDGISGSQETGVSTDINTEISSVVSNLEMGRKSSLEDHQEVPPPSSSSAAAVVGPQDLDCLWGY